MKIEWGDIRSGKDSSLNSNVKSIESSFSFIITAVKDPELSRAASASRELESTSHWIIWSPRFMNREKCPR